jgi:pilus assembly protein CpaD
MKPALKQLMARSAVAMLAAISTTACVNAGVNYTGAEEMLRNEVRHVRLVEAVSFDANQQLGESEQARVDDFLQINDVRYGDQVSLDSGSGDNARAMHATMRKFLLSRSINLLEEGPITGPEPAAGTAILVIDRSILIPPNCSGWSINQAAGNIGTPSPGFGCSSQQNLGQMVADPQDLVDGEEMEGADPDSASRAVREYREGIASDGGIMPSPVSESSGGPGGSDRR